VEGAARTGGAGGSSHAAGNHQLASASIQGPALLATNFNVGSRRSGINSATDLDIEADAEASLPGIIEEVKRLQNAEARRLVTERTKRNEAAHRDQRAQEWADAVERTRRGWNGSPISLGRLHAELWPLIKNEDVCCSAPANFTGGHAPRLFPMDKPYSYLGSQGAGGMGYGAPASV